MHPEDGRSAIAAAARAIAELRLGRVDEISTANVGTITGGTAANIVPEWCTFVAEARSHDERRLGDLVQEMQDAITFAAGVAECDVETRTRKSYRGYRFAQDRPRGRPRRRGARASRPSPSPTSSREAPPTRMSSTIAASQCVNLANGMTNIHTPDEHIAVADLEAHGRCDPRAVRRGCRSRLRRPPRCRLPRAMRIGVAKEIKSDEYRVALTPAGALELINHGHEVAIETGAGDRQLRSPTPTTSASARASRLRRRGLGRVGPRAEGEGADRGGVPAAARGPDSLHLPAHRGRRAADARAARLGHHRRRVRDGRGRTGAAAARADVRGRRPARLAGGRLLPREAARRPRACCSAACRASRRAAS